MAIDPDTNREIGHLRDHFQTMLDAVETRYAERTRAEHEAVRVALNANEKRLDGMNDFGKSLSEIVGTMITRHESEVARAAIADRAEQWRNTLSQKIDSETDSLHKKVEDLGKPNWPLLASFVSLFLVVVTGVWIVIGLKIDATLTPLSLEIHEVKVAHAADAAQAQQRLSSLEARSNENSVQLGSLDQKLIEVETQFCANDIVRNLNFANDQRFQAMMWHKIYPNAIFPTDNSFYPQVCNRASLPANSKR